MFLGNVKAAVAVVTVIFLCLGMLGSRARSNDKPVTYLIEDVNRLPPEASRWHSYVSKPLWPGELAYRQIPWLVDLDEAVRAARDENRPLLLWTSGDAPLDRC